MSAEYPSEIATLTNPISAEGLNQPTTGVPHSVIETRQNEEIIAIETELGTGLKGTKTSLAERIAVGINSDGTLKSDAIDLSGLVPYTGATTDVDLGIYDLTATDITSKGNIKILNEKFIQGRNYADSAEVDILKVNTDDEVEAGADFNFGLMEYVTITEPISPDQESTYMYQEATGTRPNRTISLLIKNELGEKIIFSTLIV